MTVADDLLKNDGQKFLEMMESLADKRIQREREVAEGMLDLDDEDEEEEEDEDEYDDDGKHAFSRAFDTSADCRSAFR